MTQPRITEEFCREVVQLMATGYSLVQVAAKQRMSKKQFNQLLVSNNESDEMKDKLKEALEFGETLYEAHFENIYVDGMVGKIHGIKENLIKAYFQNKFKWSDKTENKTKEDDVSKLSDSELAERIKRHQNVKQDTA